MHFPHSVGLLYSAFTYYLGFRVNSGEYKLMGLAPYGDPQAHQTTDFIEKIKGTLVDVKEDGSIWMNQEYFKYATGLRMAHDQKWEQLFGLARRAESETIESHHCNLALAIQQVTEEIVMKMALEARKITQSNRLCLAGGVALNCVANGKLLKSGEFDDIYIQPASGDAGGALGAALAVHFVYFDQPRISQKDDLMQGAYLGPDYSIKEITLMNRRNKAVCDEFANIEQLSDQVAEFISQGNVVGWFQGRSEFGPRALGNRSILADPRNPEMQKKLNLKIKYREGFRPFAPSVLDTEVNEYFDLQVPSPYMLLVAPVVDQRQLPLPNGYHEQSLQDKLYFLRSDLPAITHLDFSARIQTVHKETNPKYWALIDAFKQKTGYGILINTSFNVRGEPMVCDPYDAYRCFMSTDMDYLVVNNFLYKKEAQPDHANKEKWAIQFKAD